MNRVLAVDTSTWWCGVALVEGAGSSETINVVGQLGLLARHSHASHLLDGADWLLDRAGWAKADLDGFVATLGPGSFTGIRVGLGTIRGLALAADRPAVGIGTLEALAEAHGAGRLERAVVMAAGRGEVYLARFDADSIPPAPIEKPRLCPIDRVIGCCAGETTLVLAPGSESLGRSLGVLPVGLRVAPIPRDVAAAAGRLALIDGLPKETDLESPLAPLYVRPPDATRKPG